MVADSAKPSQELLTLRLLNDRFNGDLRANHVVQLLDDFVHEGPNGRHQCIVLELLDPTLRTMLAEYAGDKGRMDEVLPCGLGGTQKMFCIGDMSPQLRAYL
jgi:hypothetical protein